MGKFFKTTGAKGAVLGLSGGIDSALTVYILKDAIGADKITALIMPDEKVTSKDSTNDALEIAGKLGVKSIVVPIGKMLDNFSFPWKQEANSAAAANIKARVRMIVLYNYANSNNCLVAGTSNRTEIVTGYFTKYGDGAADFLPIASLLKTEVGETARELGVYEKIINKVPSAELWKGQTDEGELGASYAEIDELIRTIIDKKENIDKIYDKIPKERANALLGRIKENVHKSKMPKII